MLKKAKVEKRLGVFETLLLTPSLPQLNNRDTAHQYYNDDGETGDAPGSTCIQHNLLLQHSPQRQARQAT